MSKKGGYNKIINDRPLLKLFKEMFVGVTGGMLGVLSATAIVAIYTLTLTFIGYKIIKYYNKKDTKLFKEIQTGQYIGIVICIIGFLPWMDSVFYSFGSSAGRYGFNSLRNEF